MNELEEIIRRERKRTKQITWAAFAALLIILAVQIVSTIDFNNSVREMNEEIEAFEKTLNEQKDSLNGLPLITDHTRRIEKKLDSLSEK